MGRSAGPARGASGVRVVAILLAGSLASACTDGGGAAEPSNPPPSTPAPTADVTPTGAVGAPDLGAPQVVATGLDVPWGLAILPDGDALVGERDNGRILRVAAEGGEAREVYQVPGVVSRSEGGLLGLALSPDYDRDRFVYAYVTGESDNRIVRFRLAERTAPEVIFDGVAKANIHNGGRIGFGPDGMLYVGTGDVSRPDVSQDPASPNGKILRLTPEGEPAPDNPTAGSPVYSLGHRNVQGLAWDEAGRLFAVEFGQDRYDEVNLIGPGRNYGWPEVEGAGGTGGGRFTEPVITWSTDEASPSGAAITAGTLYVAALRGQRLWTVPLLDGRTGEPRAELRGEYGRLRTVVVAPDGALWVTTSNTDANGDPRDGDDRVLRFPAR